MPIQKNSQYQEEFKAGETKLIKFYMKNGKKDDAKIPVDLNGYEANLKVCKWGEMNNIILNKPCTIDQDTTLGLITYNLIPEDTKTWTDGTYIFQLTLTYSSQTTYKKQGKWYVTGGIGV